MRKNIKMQINTISKRCKDKVKELIEHTLYRMDCIYYYNKYHKFYKGQSSTMQTIKAKVSLATAWFIKGISNCNITGAEVGVSPYIIENSANKDEIEQVRRNQLNSQKQ